MSAARIPLATPRQLKPRQFAESPESNFGRVAEPNDGYICLAICSHADGDALGGVGTSNTP